jgi:hypothetical protein
MRQNLYLPLALTCLSIASSSVVNGQTLKNNSILQSLQSFTASTIPPSGDLNPYGVAFVPQGFPTGANIAPGDVLVSNFNNSSNLQGTGTTIVSVTPTGQQSLFATSTLIGLDTALGVLSKGFVIVGNLPVTYPGGVATPGQGSLQIFDINGNLVSTLNDATLLDSPWDLTVFDQGATALVFVSNVLSGTVTRLNLSVTSSSVTVTSKTQIASGYAHQPNSAAVVVGPTGMAYDNGENALYVASTADNTIFVVLQAATRTSSGGVGVVVSADQTDLHGPLGVALAANGNLLVANGDAVNSGGVQNELLEFMRSGFLVATYQMDSGAPGSAFGVAAAVLSGSIRVAATDDNLNTVTVWTLP